MIVCYHTEIIKPWTDDELHKNASLIPAAILEKILRKKNHLDVQLSIAGNLLLLKLIEHFKSNLTLADITYNDYHRPQFKGSFDFNISHAGNRVICCATDQGCVGIDIEKIKPVTLNYQDYFTPVELNNILTAASPETEFFSYWTRKEALLKAVGTGVYTPLLEMDVSADGVTYKGIAYQLMPIVIADNYKGCIAVTTLQAISVSEVLL